MAPDELAAGDDRDPVRLPPWFPVVGALLVVTVVGYALTRGGGGTEPAPDTARTPTASASSVPPEPVTPTATGYPPLEGPLLLAGPTCVQVEGRRFVVVFAVRNAGLRPVTVLSMSAHLPLAGLRPIGGRVPAERSCGRNELDPGTSTLLEPGERLPVALGFELPADCPAPYPVQADVALAGASRTPATQRLWVLADLGGFQDSFATCGGQPSR